MVQDAFIIIQGVLVSCYSENRHITIPEGVKRIRECAFSGCENMERITLPGTLKIIDSMAFLNCRTLQSITLPRSTRLIGKAAFKGCWGLADENGLVVVNRMVHDYCGESTDVVIPEGVRTIGYEAFYRNRNIRSVTIPETVTGISLCAFDGCENLTIRTPEGSYAHAYALHKQIPCVTN